MPTSMDNKCFYKSLGGVPDVWWEVHNPDGSYRLKVHWPSTREVHQRRKGK